MPRTTKLDEYRMPVATVSIDSITEAIEEIINQLQSHPTPNKRFLPAKTDFRDNAKIAMGGNGPQIDRLVRKLKHRLLHLEKWSELSPSYTFRSIDSKENKIHEYYIRFEDSPTPLMIVDVYEKGLADNSPESHSSHIIDLHREPSAFQRQITKAFSLIGVAVLVELLII
jgi:hypothetical protein